MKNKGKRIPTGLLEKLIQSKRDIEDKIIGRVVAEGGIQDPYLNEAAMEMSKTIKDANIINEKIAKDVLHHIKRTTLPQAKAFEKKKDFEMHRGAAHEKHPKGK